jgi:phosphoribosylaminoimidazole carboxylase
MLNILGGANPDSHELLIRKALSTHNSALHMYGKTPKPGRKIGHITVIASDMAKAQQAIAPLIAEADKIRTERQSPPQTTKASDTAVVKQPSSEPNPSSP